MDNYGDNTNTQLQKRFYVVPKLEQHLTHTTLMQVSIPLKPKDTSVDIFQLDSWSGGDSLW